MKKRKKVTVAINVEKVIKTYTLRHEKPTLVENLLSRSKKEVYTALDNVSFEVAKGSRLGIVGRNGSGKTTLLKLLAGITKQQQGRVSVNGRVVSLIDLSAGFHPDLTGEENIFLNGLVIGMTRDELELKKQQIVNFAQVGQFIDAPLYTYSSGMKLRLGFAVAVHSNPDILLIDEGFAVGDDNFRKKANKKMIQFQKQKKTLVMVSHWLSELKRNCDTFLWLEKGTVKMMGGSKVLREYEKFNK